MSTLELDLASCVDQLDDALDHMTTAAEHYGMARAATRGQFIDMKTGEPKTTDELRENYNEKRRIVMASVAMLGAAATGDSVEQWQDLLGMENGDVD